MVVLITGGAGFIGSNFIYFLLKKRPTWKIICIDALTYAANIHTLDEAITKHNFIFYKEDIRNKEKINEIFRNEKPDIVINFAAETHVDNSLQNPELFFDTNIIGTNILLEACKKYQISRFHQISTDEVYGDLPLDNLELKFNEYSPIKPNSPYSISKASADFLVQSYYRAYNLPITISRCSNNFGPYQFPEKLIPFMFYRAINNNSLPLYGTGLNIRDWIYVEDHCDGILKIIEHGTVGEIYNIGASNEKTNLEIVKIILNQLEKPDSLITFVQDRPGHDLRYAIDSNKIMTELKWTPKINFIDGINETIKWYQENQNWVNYCLTK